MELLCYEKNWSNSIGTFARHLLQRGVIEKGLRGELYSRLVLILAHDWLRWGRALAARASPRFTPTFTVDEFLTSLYASKYHKLIRKIPSEILEARMNFTHFVSTSEHLYLDAIPELCHDLLRRSAALQLANQPTYDKLIPIYFDKKNEPFNASQWGVIMMHDKNGPVAMSVRSVFMEDFTKIGQKTDHTPKPPKIHKTSRGCTDAKSEKRKKPDDEDDIFIFHGVEKTILLMFNMGVSPIASLHFEVSYSNYTDPRVWAIHSRGHSRDVFGCVEKMDGLNECEVFFSSSVEASGKYADIVKENMAFDKLARAFRHPTVDGAGKDGHAGETGDDGGQDITDDRM